jgi:hypothetical protein
MPPAQPPIPHSSLHRHHDAAVPESSQSSSQSVSHQSKSSSQTAHLDSIAESLGRGETHGRVAIRIDRVNVGARGCKSSTRAWPARAARWTRRVKGLSHGSSSSAGVLPSIMPTVTAAPSFRSSSCSTMSTPLEQLHLRTTHTPALSWLRCAQCQLLREVEGTNLSISHSHRS